MKKIIIGMLAVGSMLFASGKEIELKSNLFDLSRVQSDEMKGALVGMELSFPSVAKVIKDYYEAKTCSVDFYNKITIQDVEDFGTTSTFNVLLQLDYLDNDAGKPTYKQLINDYKFMNCGIGKINQEGKKYE
jgi:hypothetical protein